MGPTSGRQIAMMAIHRMNSHVMALPSDFSASACRPSPSRMDATMLPPLPMSVLSAIVMTMNGMATVVAAMPASPTPMPMKMPSTRP